MSEPASAQVEATERELEPERAAAAEHPPARLNRGLLALGVVSAIFVVAGVALTVIEANLSVSTRSSADTTTVTFDYLGGLLPEPLMLAGGLGIAAACVVVALRGWRDVEDDRR